MTGSYKGFQGVTSVLQGVTKGDRGLQGVTGGYKCVTRGLQGVTAGDKGLQRVTRGYKELPGVPRGDRG